MSRLLLAWFSAGILLAGCGDDSNGPSSGPSIYAITTDNRLLRFESDAPAAGVTNPITGLPGGDRIVGIDFRPADGVLYGAGSDDRLYTIDPQTAVATAVGAGAFATALNGTHFGFDFNPTVDRIRVGSAESRQNLRLNPETGALTAVDTDFSYATPSTPEIGGLAYSNSVAGAATTALYGIDATADALVTLAAPNTGVMTTVGALGVNTSSSIGFDIEPGTEAAYATLTSGGVSSLYTVNLSTGAVTLVGGIAVTGEVDGIAIAP